MNSFVSSALVGVILACLLNISVAQAVLPGTESSSFEPARNGAAVEFEALLLEYLEQMQELKDLIHRYLANPPHNFHKRAQFLRLGR